MKRFHVHVDDLAGSVGFYSTADLTLPDVGETTCCYARSDKHWITDPA